MVVLLGSVEFTSDARANGRVINSTLRLLVPWGSVHLKVLSMFTVQSWRKLTSRVLEHTLSHLGRTGMQGYMHLVAFVAVFALVLVDHSSEFDWPERSALERILLSPPAGHMQTEKTRIGGTPLAIFRPFGFCRRTIYIVDGF